MRGPGVVKLENGFRRDPGGDEFFTHEFGHRHPGLDGAELSREVERGQKRRQKGRLEPRVLPGAIGDFAGVICRPMRRIQPPSGPKITAHRKWPEIVDVLKNGNLLPLCLVENAAGNHRNIIVQNPRLGSGFFLRHPQASNRAGIVKREGGLFPVGRRLRTGPFRALENSLGEAGILGKNPGDFLRGQPFTATAQGAIKNLEEPV